MECELCGEETQKFSITVKNLETSESSQRRVCLDCLLLCTGHEAISMMRELLSEINTD